MTTRVRASCSFLFHLVPACDSTGSPVLCLSACGECSASGTRKPGEQQAQALCLDHAGGHFSCSHSVLMQEAQGLLASLSSISTP